MPSKFPDALVEQLVENGLLSDTDRAAAVNEQKSRGGALCDILVAKGMVTDRQLLGCFARQHGLHPIMLDSLAIEPDIIELIPEKVAVYYQAVPIGRAGNYLTIAMVDPLNVFALDDLALITNHKISPLVTLASEVQGTLDRHYHVAENYDEVLASIGSGDDMVDSTVVREINIDRERGDDSDAAPVIKLVNVVLTQAIDDRASDIHIEPFEKRISIRYRVDGVLYERPSPPFSLLRPIISRIKVISQLDIAEHRLPQDGRFRIRTKGREVDFRVSSLPTAHGEKIVMRVLDKTRQSMDMERLDMDPVSLGKLRVALELPHGMILVTGPTGSGKTTTLYSCLQRLNTPKVNIVTVEDPVEYQFPGINQMQVNPDIKLTFASGLRSILRQDPDIVMVGEVRDFETADIAVKAALTGHLVLTTLHTNDAAATFARIADMGVEPYLTASAMQLVVAQRLARRLCVRCRKPATLDAGVLARAQYRPSGDEAPAFHTPVGCQYCRQTGYMGRIALLEVLVASDDMRRLILSNAEARRVKELAIQQGMLSLRQAGLWRAAQGVTTIEEVLRVTASD